MNIKGEGTPTFQEKSPVEKKLEDSRNVPVSNKYGDFKPSKDFWIILVLFEMLLYLLAFCFPLFLTKLSLYCYDNKLYYWR